MNDTKTTKVIELIGKLTKLVGVSAGIVLISIGGIMLLQAILKLYVFDIKTSQYPTIYGACDVYDIDRLRAVSLTGSPAPVLDPEPIKSSRNTKKYSELTKEDKEFLKRKYSECIKKEQKSREESFSRDMKMDIANGIAFSLVGSLLLFFYGRRRKLHKK